MTFLIKKDLSEIEYTGHIRMAQQYINETRYRQAALQFIFASQSAVHAGKLQHAEKAMKKSELLFKMADEAEMHGMKRSHLLLLLRIIL
jgi:hypothetical protein